MLDPDARAGRQVQLGFEREGVPTAVGQIPADAATRLDLPVSDTGLVVIGGTDGHALDLVRRARHLLSDTQIDAPIIFAGRGVRRTDAEAAGADEVVLQPTYLRDLVTIGRLLRGQPAGQRDHIVGSLAETTGVFTLVRALSALGRSAVLTLIRGLRRGEIRFFHGEVTSAQVGVIHGQAAFHQLLLWTEARFDFRHEDVVRRHQIPLTHGDLFADAERFLEGVRDASGALSPSMVLEQDSARVKSLGKQVPTEVHGVLRMFDGHRVLADVLEDSPYRVFETLRVTQRAVDVGLLRAVDSQRPKASWRTVLAIEEWLVGTDKETVLARTAAESGPMAAASRDSSRDTGKVPKGGKRQKKKKRRANTPVPIAATNKVDIDWGALVPRTVGAEVGPLSGVVPAAQTSGELEVPTRETQREKLEALMDTGKRERIFPTDIGLEPKVVFEDDQRRAEAEAEAARIEDARKREAADLAARLASARAEAEAAIKAKADLAAQKQAKDAPSVLTAEPPPPEPDRASDLVKQLVAEHTSDPVTVSETPSTVVAVHDTMTVTSSPDTARLVATPVAIVTEAPAPQALVDEPSDGIVRQLTTVETAPVPRPPPPPNAIPDDRPDDATGEITAPRDLPMPRDPRASEPSILVSDSPEVASVRADLAAAQQAIQAVVAAQAAAPATVDVATPSRELAVAEVRQDAQAGAAAFSDAEEAFFRAGHEKEKEKGTKTAAAPKIETFDDLDEGYQPVGFWDRLRGKKKR